MLWVCISKSLLDSCDGAALDCPLLKSTWARAARGSLRPSLSDGLVWVFLPRPASQAGVLVCVRLAVQTCRVSQHLSPQADMRLLGARLEVGVPRAASVSCPELTTSELCGGSLGLFGSATDLQCDWGKSFPF